jgi:uncharacterized protein YjbJ (UPF0337 family)
MNTDIAEGKWKQLKGKIQKQWGDLTDDDLDKIKGSRKEFAGVMQERYGKARDEAEREFDKFRSANM